MGVYRMKTDDRVTLYDFVLTAVTCPKIPVPQNGFISGCQPPYSVGAVCTQGCNASFVAFGNTVYRTCQSTGMWGGSMLSCQPYAGTLFLPQNFFSY